VYQALGPVDMAVGCHLHRHCQCQGCLYSVGTGQACNHHRRIWVSASLAAKECGIVGSCVFWLLVGSGTSVAVLFSSGEGSC
jgi:hypothetical protein